MRPIPENARSRDPRWERDFLDLAYRLVMAGAKAKLIERFTDLSHGKVKELYKALRGIAPPAGPVVQASANHFALPGKKTSEADRIQYAIFLACYEHMGRISSIPPQRGWRLLTSFNAYLDLTEHVIEVCGVKRMDINEAYALLTYCGFMIFPKGAELERTRCSGCSINYPTIASIASSLQRCPVCAMNTYWQHLFKPLH